MVLCVIEKQERKGEPMKKQTQFTIITLELTVAILTAGCSQSEQIKYEEAISTTVDEPMTVSTTAAEEITAPDQAITIQTTTVSTSTATTPPVTTETAAETTEEVAEETMILTTSEITTATAPVPVSTSFTVYVPADVETLLNGAELNPMKTNTSELDDMVDDILSRITEDSMSTFRKVTAIYDYITDNFSYGSPETYYYSNTDYYPGTDEITVSNALTMLKNGTGVCDHYSALFTVMTRAIGLETYTVSGKVASKSGGMTGHTWANVKLNGKYYIFDPQVDRDNPASGRYNYFCRTDESLAGVYSYGTEEFFSYWAAAYPDRPITTDDIRDHMIRLFNGFKVRTGG